MSGAKASRPGLNRLMTDTCARKFDCLPVWKLDRFGRSLVDSLNNIRTLEDMLSGSLPSPRTWIPISGPGVRFLQHVLGAAAEFERALIRERTQAGRVGNGV